MTGLLLLALAAAPTHSSWKFATGPKAKVDLSNISGSVQIRGAATSEVKVDATVTERGDKKVWTLDVKGEGEEVRVRACCGPCDANGRRHCDAEAEVAFVLEVPEASSLEVSAVSSSVQIEKVRGAQHLSVVSGRVRVDGASDELSVSSVSGEVRVAPRTLRPFQVSSVSGDVKLDLPKDADATVMLSTLSGAFNGKRIGMGSHSERFGKGTHEIGVSTVSGSVDVKTAATAEK